MSETWWIREEQLDEDQKAFASLGPSGSHLIVGPPGCGKTNLLLLRAKYMFLAGHTNILVVVFTRTLREFISSGTSAYQLPEEAVQTLRKWQMDFLREHGVLIKVSGTFEEQRALMAEEIAKLVQAKNFENLYDAIFLDEAHDYLPLEIETFRKLGKVITAAADEHQKIYSVTDCMPLVRRMVDNEHVLKYHYRLGTEVCKLADGIMHVSPDYQPLAPTCNYNEGARPSSVEIVSCKSLEDQVDKILERVRIQARAYPGELIGVICPYVEQLERIWQIVSNSDQAASAMRQGGGDHSNFDDAKLLHVGTLHSAKGIEFRAVHFACCESVRDFPYERNMTYMAVTRAKTSLSVYHSGTLPGYLRQAFTKLQPPPKLPKTSDLFGKQGSK